MSWWVTETWVPAAFVLVSLAIVLGAMATSTGRGTYALAAGGCLLAVGLAYLADLYVVTPSEEVVERTHSLADAYVDEERERFFDHLAADALVLRGKALLAFEAVEVDDDLRITDVSVTMADDEQSARIHFRANATINVATQGSVGYHPSRWHLDWERDADEWKLVEATRLDVMTGEPIAMLSRE